MLKVFIKNPKPTPFLQQFMNRVGGNHSPGPTQMVQQQQQYPGMVQKWDKLRYSGWLTGVMQEFKVGDMVTLKLSPPQQGRIPYLMKVIYIEEMHNLVEWDKVKNLPCALRLQSALRPQISFNRVPDEIRKLTYEELQLVRLQNTQPQGHA